MSKTKRYVPRHLHPDYFAREYGPRRHPHRKPRGPMTARAKRGCLVAVMALLAVTAASLPAPHPPSAPTSTTQSMSSN